MTNRAGLRQEANFEQAVMVVRVVLSTLALVLGVGEAASEASFASIAPPVSIFLIASGWALAAWRLGRALQADDAAPDSQRRRALQMTLHGGDTLGSVGLAFAIGQATPGSSWVLLTVPIVIASVRFSSRAVILTWAGASAGYALCDRLWPSHFDISASALVEQSGLLLAVAASVALLTRWLEEGWRAQAEATLEAERARDQLNVIQSASQSMRVGKASELLDITATSTISLGFEACVVSSKGEPTAVAGDASFVPSGIDTALEIESGKLTDVELTEWSDAAGTTCFSAAVTEPRTGATVTGWQRSPIDDSLASSLAHLISHTSTNIEAARHLDQARYAASHDPLTRTVNRATIQSFVDRDQPTNAPFIGAIFIDLDYFKQVNDTHGHATGDQLLISIARRIQGIVGKTALTGRYGGDEFVVLGDIADPETLTATAHRIRETLAEPHALNGVEIRSSASIGVAYTIHENRHHLLEWADQAAYEAKRGGRNRVAIHQAASGDFDAASRADHEQVELPNGS